MPARSDELAPEAGRTIEAVAQHWRAHELQAALVSTWTLVNRANQYVDQTAPFKLAKDPAQAARLDEVLYNLGETCRVLAVLLWPFVPGTAEKIYAQLGLKTSPTIFTEASFGRKIDRGVHVHGLDFLGRVFL